MADPSQPDALLDAVAPALAAGDAEALAAAVRGRWSPRALCTMLGHGRAEVRRVAALVLGVVGERPVVGCLTRCLHDRDAQVRQLGEDALWSIWFRGGRPEAMADFGEGLANLGAEAYDDAVEAFARATRADPDFAEAYNQSAIAHYLAGRWHASRADAKRALARMPTHFGAMAGLGHCEAHLQRYRGAADCYRRALAIHPGLTELPAAIRDLQTRITEQADRCMDSGAELVHHARRGHF